MSDTTPDEGHEPSSTIEWLELFFDLVVVAAVAVLTEGLRENPTWAGVGLFALLYAGIWFSWVQAVLYANVAGSATRTRTIVTSMFLVAVMAATAPIHFEGRANAFAIAFVVLRMVTSRSALRTGRILQGWPLLQFGRGDRAVGRGAVGRHPAEVRPVGGPPRGRPGRTRRRQP